MYTITKDDYYDNTQPAKTEELANYIEVYTQPLAVGESEEVYRSNETITVQPHSTSEEIEIIFDSPPVIDAVISLDETVSLVVDVNQVYAWGAKVTLQNGSGVADSALIVVTGKKLVVTGEEIVVAKDDASIMEYGIQKYTLPKNGHIQTRAMAQAIANSLLASYKAIRKDVDLNWRGDPSQELTDDIEVPVYQKNGIDTRGQFYITKNVFDFDGTLKQQTSGRKTS